MSAAATAAGYLYASGRLRGRGAREQEEHQDQKDRQHDRQPRAPQAKPHRAEQAEPREIRVAVLEEKPRRTPKIEYRTRKRWTAGA